MTATKEYWTFFMKRMKITFCPFIPSTDWLTEWSINRFLSLFYIMDLFLVFFPKKLHFFFFAQQKAVLLFYHHGANLCMYFIFQYFHMWNKQQQQQQTLFRTFFCFDLIGVCTHMAHTNQIQYKKWNDTQ